MLIKDSLSFPADLFLFTVQGLVHDSKAYVWFNLPTLDKTSAYSLELKHVGNMDRPPSEWGTAAALGASVGSSAAWMGTVVTTTSLVTPPMAPIAFSATGISGGLGVMTATTHVGKMFEEPTPQWEQTLERGELLSLAKN